MNSSEPRGSWQRICLLGLAALAAVLLAHAQAPVRDRIVQNIDNTRMFAVRGNIHPLARAEYDQGKVDGSMRMQRITIAFKPTASQQASLDALLAQQQDRSSPNYHKWLSPEEYASQFGVSQNDLDKVVSWLQSQGFSVDEAARSRTWVAFSGSAAQVESAFHTEIHHYNVNGETHFANAGEPFVPSAFSDMVSCFRGLNDFRPKARAFKKRTGIIAKPDFTSSLSGSNFIAPPDFATVYDLNPLYGTNFSGISGTGQKIAVMGQTDIVMSDISTFRSLSGLPANNLTVILIPGGDPGMRINSGDLGEADLDLEWAGAVAPNATIIYVNSGPPNGVFDSFVYAVDNKTAPVISNSYGVCEPDIGQAESIALGQVAEQANAEGITVVAPSGDSGATDCDASLPATGGLAVDFPASLPYVTGVGGTTFNEGSGTYWIPKGAQDVIPSALSYIPEVVWNDTTLVGEPSASGGGASEFFSKPTWQTGAGVPSDGARDVPDIAIDASPNHDGYLICTQAFVNGGSTTSSTCTNNTFRYADSSQPMCTPSCLAVYGGTSTGVPTFAGMVALINQEMSSTGQGNVNPTLYALAAKVPSAFHDITTGNNGVSYLPVNMAGCSTSSVSIGYNATAGYDQTTGLGSVDADVMVTQWSSVSPAAGSGAGAVDFQLGFSTTQMTVKHGTCGAATVIVAPINSFAGTPSFSCAASSTLGATTCAVTPVASASLGNPRNFNDFDWLPMAEMVLICVLLLAASKRAGGSHLSAGGAYRIRPNFAPGLAFVCLLTMAIGCGGSKSASSSSTSNSSSGVANASLSGTHYALTVAVPASTSAASGTVTVTGTIGGISHAAQIAVTVN